MPAQISRKAALAAAVSLGLATSACFGSFAGDRSSEPVTAAAQPGSTSAAQVAAGLPDFASLAERYGPAVVTVAVVG